MRSIGLRFDSPPCKPVFRRGLEKVLSVLLMGLVVLPVIAVRAQAPDPAPAPGEAPTVVLQYPNTPLSEILLLYEELTQMKIIKDINVVGATVSIETTGKMTRKEAAEFIEKSLLLNGFAFTPSGPNLLKIISFGAGKQPRTEGIPIFSRVEDLPETEQVVHFFMPLTYISADDALRVFTQLVPNHPYGVIVPVPNASAVLITENSFVIRSLVEVKAYVDVPPGNVVKESIQLLRADAEEVAALLGDLLGQASQSGGSGGSRGLPSGQQRTVGLPTAAQAQAQAAVIAAAGVTGAPAGAAGGGGVGGGGGTGPEPQILPIVRTNKILVIARPLDMTYIKGLVAEFDAAGEITNFLRRKLNYMSVREFLPIANDALSRGLDEGGAGIGGQQGTLGRTTTSTAASGFQRGTAAGAGGIGGGIGGGGAGGGIGGAGAGLGDPEEFAGPESLVVGKTLIIADSRANTLLASGPPEHLRVITELLDELDVRPAQIYLSTVIGQLSLTDEFEFGLDILRTAEDIEAGGGNATIAGLFRTRNDPIVNVDDLAPPLSDTFPILSGLNLYLRVGEHFNAYLKALEATTKFTVLSRPSVFARNNTKATIQTGQRIAVPTTSLTTLDTGTINPSVTSNIEFRDVVLRLEVIPLVNSENEVTLQIAQLNDNVIGQQTVGGNEVPIIGTEELITEVTIPNKSTVVLGGLISTSKNEAKTGVPWLIKVPVLKHIFGSTDISEERRELLIFIQPYIIISEADLVDANVDLTRRTAVAEDAMEFALPAPPVPPPGVPEGEEAPTGYNALFPRSQEVWTNDPERYRQEQERARQSQPGFTR